jgi:RNA polymerase sigma-70 factor (ECF subfamily)
VSNVSGNCGPRTRASTGRSRRSERSSKNERLTDRPASAAVPLAPENREWQAFEEMFTASRAKFMGLAYGILRNKEDAEDAIQDALVSAYVHLRRFEGRSAIKTWFTRVVVNASLMVRRKRKPARAEFALETAGADDPFAMEQIPASNPDPEMYCAETETLHLVDGLVGELSPALRQAFRMAYFDEIPVKQAGALVGVARGTFKSRLCRAKKHLKRMAERALVTPIRGARPFPFFRRPADFEGLRAKTAEVWSREMAF